MRTPNVCPKSRWRQPGPLWWRAGGALNKALRQVGNGPGAGCRAASALHAAWAGHDTRPLRGPMVQLQSPCPPCGACVNGQRGGTRRVCALAHRYAAQGRAWRLAHGCCRHAGGPGCVAKGMSMASAGRGLGWLKREELSDGGAWRPPAAPAGRITPPSASCVCILSWRTVRRSAPAASPS